MPRKSANPGLGKSIVNNKKKRAEEHVPEHTTGVAEIQSGKSVLEQSSLDDFLETAALAQRNFDALRGEAYVMQGDVQVVAEKITSTRDAEAAAHSRRVLVPVPRRPAWDKGTTAEELGVSEGQAFVQWRRDLAALEEDEGLVMTPYEKNLDFWRQLWRCLERSDLVVQILDARDPDFYRSRDLERYVSEFGSKKFLLLVNKSDYLTPDLHAKWSAYFAEQGIEALFFSAMSELRRQQDSGSEVRWKPDETQESEDEDESEEDEGGEVTVIPEEEEEHGTAESTDVPVPDSDEDFMCDCEQLLREIRTRLCTAGEAEAAESSTTVQDERKRIVGFVGYPNVGKSTVINALWGSKKVSMSRTPGKTKHLQTLDLPGTDITLCDCPGLVFPSVAASKAHLAINGTVPYDELRDYSPAVRLIIEKVGIRTLLKKYSCAAQMKDSAERVGEASIDECTTFLAAFACKRNHYLRLHVPDNSWAARRILKDYFSGNLLHCELPPGCVREEEEELLEAEVVDDDDFDDMGDFVKESGKPQKLTKRAQRMAGKRIIKAGGSWQACAVSAEGAARNRGKTLGC